MSVHARLRSVVLAGALLFVTADLVWLPRSSVSVPPPTFLRFLRTMAVLGAVSVAGAAVKRRLGADPAPIARRIRRAAEGLRILARSGALFILLAVPAGVFMYVVSATGRPLQDAALAAIDRGLGLDWPMLLAAFNATPALATVLALAYHTTGPQIPALFLFLSMTGREGRLVEFLAHLAVTSVLTGLLMALVPAAGAYAHFEPPPETHDHFTAQAGMWHHEDLMALRSGTPFVYDAARAQGLVTFPSYHTVLAVITAYAVRRIPWVGPAVAALNVVVIVGTVPEGGHHVVDVLVGALIAAVSIAGVAALVGRLPAPG